MTVIISLNDGLWQNNNNAIPKKGIYFFQEKEDAELSGSIDKYKPEAAYFYIMNTE